MEQLTIELPDWITRVVTGTVNGDEARMEVAITLARESVRHGGGPFGAVVFDAGSGRVVAAGANLVVPQRTALAHAEVVALFAAQRALGSHSLKDAGAYELYTSCEPCAMCLGATLWSGVRRLVCGAAREDAARIGFDEGPVFDESYRYLEVRGIAIVRGVQRESARAVLEDYVARGGVVYNP